jgi:hypothetical protein
MLNVSRRSRGTQRLAGALDRLADHPAVELDLLFAGAAAHAGTAGLALQVGPAPDQPRAEVLQAREFDLQLAFVRAGALREDFQDEKGPVVHRDIERSLEVALLRRTQCLVEDDLACAMHQRQFLDFVGLAAAHEKGGVGRLALAHNARHRLESRGLCEQAEFLQFAVEMRQSEVDADEDGGAFLG